MTESQTERIRNIGLRATGVNFYNAFIREGETRQEAMESIRRAAKILAQKVADG